MPSLSLAALRYRDVFADDGGPIERVLTGDFSILGQPHKQANAFLRPELTAGKSTFAIYGQADGTGSAGSAAIACHMAISEALERWAFLAVHNRPEGRRYEQLASEIERALNFMRACGVDTENYAALHEVDVFTNTVYLVDGGSVRCFRP